MPRKTSTKTVASRRSGNSAGRAAGPDQGEDEAERPAPPPRPRTKILTSSQKAASMSGKESLKALQEKKVSRTSGQPGLVRTSAARPPRTTTLETAAIAWPRRARRRLAASRAARRSTDHCGLGHPRDSPQRGRRQPRRGG